VPESGADTPSLPDPLVTLQTGSKQGQSGVLLRPKKGSQKGVLLWPKMGSPSLPLFRLKDHQNMNSCFYALRTCFLKSDKNTFLTFSRNGTSSLHFLQNRLKPVFGETTLFALFGGVPHRAPCGQSCQPGLPQHPQQGTLKGALG